MTMRTLLLAALGSVLIHTAQAQLLNIELRSPMPADPRDDAMAFSLDGVGYVLGGRKADFGLSPQVWSYHPGSDSWEARNDFPGAPRQYAETFVLDGRAHLIAGVTDPAIYLAEHWVYDALSDTWQQLSDFPAGGRLAPLVFRYGQDIFLGGGRGQDTTYSDLWRYLPESDSWQWHADFGTSIYGALAAVSEDGVFISGGILADGSISDKTWCVDEQGLREIGVGLALANADIASVDGIPILMGGRTPERDAIDSFHLLIQDDWGFHWKQTDFKHPIGIRRNGTGFSIGQEAYYFGGKDSLGVKYNDLILVRVKEGNESPLVYPNPSNGICYVYRASGDRSFKLYDVTGREVWAKEQDQGLGVSRLDLKRLGAGWYSIVWSDGITARLLITR